MKTTMVAVALALVAGCGSAENPAMQADGAWILALNQGCSMTLSFNVAEHRYAAQQLCQLTDGSWGDDLEEGTADFTIPGQVTLAATRASCPTSPRADGVMLYSRSGTQLALQNDTGTAFFDRVPPTTGGVSAVVRYGCWTMGTFTTHPVDNL